MSQTPPPYRPDSATAGSAAPVVAVRNLSKRFGTVLAVDALSFDLAPGSVTGFLGPNGAGKSTTLRLLLGLAHPTSGEALVFGHAYRDLPDPARRVGALLESGDFDPGRSGRNHLRVLAFATGVGPSRVDELLELVELDRAADRLVSGYSLGMRQRLGLAAGLLGQPELLILDEPANGLDAAGVHWLRGFIRQYAAAGGTVLVSSHLLAEVAQTVDRALIINNGSLVASVNLSDVADGAELEALYLDLTSGAAA